MAVEEQSAGIVFIVANTILAGLLWGMFVFIVMFFAMLAKASGEGAAARISEWGEGVIAQRKVKKAQKAADEAEKNGKDKK